MVALPLQTPDDVVPKARVCAAASTVGYATEGRPGRYQSQIAAGAVFSVRLFGQSNGSHHNCFSFPAAYTGRGVRIPEPALRGL
ncbi:hypothetical protein KCP78_18800 [Salmonella enterica subsp. enterica]|nr:hypothetical protein KCP78_18800 [Salmonella enterica subsp. enterica]